MIMSTADKKKFPKSQAKDVSLSDAADMLGFKYRPSVKQFEEGTGLKPIHILNTGTRSFAIYSRAVLEEWLERNGPFQSRLEKKREERKSEPPPVEKIIQNDIALCTAAINAQSVRLDGLVKRVEYVFEKQQSLSDKIDALAGPLGILTEKLKSALSELGVK